MSLHIGRKYSIGIGKESTRGTAVAATHWLPKMELTIDDKINYAVNESSVGVIEDAIGQDITSKYSEGSVSGRLSDTNLGLILIAALGSETATTLVETGIYDHVFNVLESAQHPTLTLAVAGTNESTGLRHALAMIDSLDIDFEINKYCQYTFGFRANANEAGANTVAFPTTENAFLPQHAIVKIATDLSGLAAASAINCRKANITISKNVEEDWTIGNLSPADRVNRQFTIEGTLEITYSARTYIDTIMLGDLAKAMRIQAINTAVTIGATSNPTLTIDLAKVKLQEVARKLDNDEIVTQTLKFKAYYSLADAKMITATLRNTTTTSY